jgi:hypothetical protein
MSTLLRNAEVNTSLRCVATLRQLVDTFSVQSAQRLYNAILVGHHTVLDSRQPRKVLSEFKTLSVSNIWSH